MKKFWRYLLLKKHSEDFLSKLNFVVFGLGDSSYPQFCFVSKRLYRRLMQLGAINLMDRADGDDQSDHGYVE